jgi:arylamine N-acetyltransferase
MNTPNVHSCIRVRVNGRAYHVDVGNAAPFLEPFPLDELPHKFVRGEMNWVFDRAADGRLRCTVFSGTEAVHGYIANEQPRSHEDFRAIILDSFQPGRTFMSLLRLVRIFPEHTVELKNRTLRVHRGLTTTETTINSKEELRRAVNEQFLMPRCPVEQAVEILERIHSVDFFSTQEERSLYA